MKEIFTVSVVIPAYNAAGFITKTLDSVRVQTFTDYEIIVVDDGSTDNTSEIVNNYIYTYSIVGKCIRQNNKKIAGARNTGIKAARGEYIALLDHDDLWYPDKLAVVLNEFNLHPGADLICHNMFMVKNGKNLGILKTGPASSDMYKKLLFTRSLLSPSATVFKKDKAVEIGGFRENPEFITVEDYDFWMRFSKVAKFYFITKILGEYSIVENGASRKIDYHHKNIEFLLRDHFASYFKNNPGFFNKIKMRKRISVVYRSALHLMIKYKQDPKKQYEYLIKMMKEFPYDLKNIVMAMFWFGTKFRKIFNINISLDQ